MNKNIKNIHNKTARVITLVLLSVVVFSNYSCNNDEVFTREQYKNVFSIVSGSNFESRLTYDLRFDKSYGYVSASLGGTHPAGKDVNVKFELTPSLLEDYLSTGLNTNQRTRVSSALDKFGKYRFCDGLQLSIPNGEFKAFMPVSVCPADLSVDSIYLIPLTVSDYDWGELNVEKRSVIIRVEFRNWWAEFGGTTYPSRGRVITTNATDPENLQVDTVTLYANKVLWPTGVDKVRMLSSNLGEPNEADRIDQYRINAINLTIDDAVEVLEIDFVQRVVSRVNIEAFGLLAGVEMVAEDDPEYNPEYPNVVIPAEDDGFNNTYKTFLLNYRFTDRSGHTVRVEEELRLMYLEDVRNPRFLPIPPPQGHNLYDWFCFHDWKCDGDHYDDDDDN